MPENTVAERVKKILVEEYSMSEEALTPKADFIDDLGQDSLDVVECIMSMEDEFSIEIPDEDAEKLRTVGDVTTYLEGRGK